MGVSYSSELSCTMAPDGERTSRKTSTPSSSTAIYSLVTAKAAKPVIETPGPKQSRQQMYAKPPDGGRKSTKASSTKMYSLATTKAVKPANKTAFPKRSQQLNLQQQQQRQRQQQQLQQIRAIRRKRTVAFAVNHERVSQPYTACVVSADGAPVCDNSSSVQPNSTQVTVSTKNNVHHPGPVLGTSTVNRDQIPSRASLVIRDSSCTFQQTALGFGEDDPVKDDTNRRPRVPSHQRSNAGRNGTPTICEDGYDTTEKGTKLNNNNRGNRLVVDVQCAEAEAAAVSKNIALTTSSSCGGSPSAPVPVTPTYLSPFGHDTNGGTANTNTKRRRVGRPPSKKLKPCPSQEREASSSFSSSRSSVVAAKVSRKPKVKRVRYDMERVPLVEMNQELWGDFCIRIRKESQPKNSPSLRRSQGDDNINDNHTRNKACNDSASKSSVPVTLSNNESSNINNLPQSSLLLRGSVLWIPSSRQEWEDCVSEMKSVCTSAAFRRWSKSIIQDYENTFCNVNRINNGINSHNSLPHSSTTMKSFQQPLSQAFIKDRVQIDDPLRGYQIRHAKGGWLQGFLVWTNFTVWTQDFQWNSNHPASGLLHDDIKSEGRSVTDDDGTLSKELQALPRGEQDPLDGGIVLKQVAEISLLGGLGCGELLLRKAIEDIRKSKNNEKCNYKYVVLQATEGSRRFYEKMGFVRVGAVCRYRWAEYCTKKNGSTSATTGKKPDLNRLQAGNIDARSTLDPPPTFHGYRHWTYTNESCKSLDAHGGPSVMMCLKLEKNDEENDQHGQQQTVSELLQPHIVHEKPVIQSLGNVSNPDSENVAPTRKSQRRSTSSGSLRGMQQQQQEQGKEDASDRLSFNGLSGSSGVAAAATTSRRTSNRSKRGQNTSLANSGYVLYGVEGGRNCSNKRIANATPHSKQTMKRQRRSAKVARNVSLEEREGAKRTNIDAVVVPLPIDKIGNPGSHEGASSIIVQEKEQAATEYASVDTTTNGSLSVKTLCAINHCEKASTEVQQPPGKGRSPNKILAICNKKNIENVNITVAPRQQYKSTSQSRSVLSASVDGIKCTESSKYNYSPDRTQTTIIPETKAVDCANKCAKSPVLAEVLVGVDENSTETANAGQIQRQPAFERGISNSVRPTGEQNREKDSNEAKKREDHSEDSSLNDRTITPSSSKEEGKIAGDMIRERVEEAGANTLALTSLTLPPKGTKAPKRRAPVHHEGTCGSHPGTIIPRKRSRQPAMAVNSSKLFKQKVSRQHGTADEFYNQVVVRRSVLDYDHHISKRKRGNQSAKKGRFRWRYNGGLMINHRYEFCYYFVLHYNETKKTLTMVPMIKDGVFERPTGSKDKSISSPVLDERFLGRPRYQCNILETDKNWIRDVPLEDYTIVQEAVAVVDTPLVAHEAWDICSDSFGPCI